MNLLKKRNVPSLEVSGVHSPYLAARREWDERYGDLITRAKNWADHGGPVFAHCSGCDGGNRLAIPPLRASFRSSFSWITSAAPSPPASRIRPP